MISIIEGRPGTGKTVYLVYKILNYLNRGIHVYTNVDLRVAHNPDDPRFGLYHYIESLEDITEVREGKIVLDEVQTYLNSRNWDKLDIKFQLLLQQHRKRGLDIIGATQSVKRADVVFRELVHYFYTLQKVFTVSFGKQVFGLFVIREYDPDCIELDKSERASHQYGFLMPLMVDPGVFYAFDTMQEVKLDDGVGKYITETYKLESKQSIGRKLISKKTYENFIESGPSRLRDRV